MPDEPPVRDELKGVEPYGAPQIDVPVRLNTNENPFPPSERIATAMGEAVADAARSLNRYPDREALALREDLAEYLRAESQVEVGADQVWPANGSNEVMLHVFSAFGGPGRLGCLAKARLSPDSRPRAAAPRAGPSSRRRAR